jgi:CBS domain-containing membrane protein
MNQHTKYQIQPVDVQNALKEIDTFVDVNMETLMMVIKLSQKHAELRNVEKILVRDIMTANVKTVESTTSMRDASQILLDMRISGLPVVDQVGSLVGIVTEADFLSALGIPCHHPAHSLWQTLDSMFKFHPAKNLTPKIVADIMSINTVSVTKDRTLHDVIDTMKQHHVKRVVVVDENNLVEGIITRSNLVRVLLQKIL